MEMLIVELKEKKGMMAVHSFVFLSQDTGRNSHSTLFLGQR